MHTLKSPHAVEDIDLVFVLTGNKHNQCLKVKRQLHFSSRRNYTMQPASWTRFFLSSLTSGTSKFTKGQAKLVIGFFFGGECKFWGLKCNIYIQIFTACKWELFSVQLYFLYMKMEFYNN